MNKTQWLLLMILLALTGCYDEKEGCLDPAALNFDVSADKDCCCEYPKLKLKVNYKETDSTSFQKMHYFKDVGEQVYKIESFSFFLSHIEVKGGAGWLDVDDSLERWVFDGQGLPEKALVSSNVVLLKNNVLKYDFGDFVDFGAYDSVRLEMGMDELQQAAIPDSLPQGHVLGVGVDSMWVSPKVYLQQKWVIVTDTSAANYTVDTFTVIGSNIPFDLAYHSAFVVKKGKDYELEIAINIPEWLKDIDWQGDKAEITDKLSNNSKLAISLVQ